MSTPEVSWSACLLLLLAAAPAPGAADLPPGAATGPKLSSHEGSPATRRYKFEGFVDFPGTEGSVRIEVLRLANASATNDPNDDSNWTVLDLPVKIRNDLSTIKSGQKRYRWEAERAAIFENPPASGDDRWPQGGIARVRFRAIHGASEEFLPVFDGDGVPGALRQLILVDEDPSLARLPVAERPSYLGAKKPVLPVLAGEEGFALTLREALETERYYKAVGIDPDGGGPSIWDALPTLQDFRERYFLDVPSGCRQRFQTNPAKPSETVGPEIVAQYFNRGDLGLGREMHCMHNSCDLETACYVSNYGGLSEAKEEEVRFGNLDEAHQALRAKKASSDAPGFSGKPIATVAMVDRGMLSQVSPTARNRVFFVAYNHIDSQDSPQLALAAALDEKAFNTHLPGNCLTCHGSGTHYDPNSHSVTGAFFLPFDLKAFQFFSSNPQSKQERALKGLNLLVLRTGLNANRDALELVQGWYGGEGLPDTKFKGSFVPSGWTNDGNSPADIADDANRRQLYSEVVAPYCRGCHISHAAFDGDDLAFVIPPGAFLVDDLTRFASLEDFALHDAIGNFVCSSHLQPDFAMPNAEQASKRFWESDARAQLVNRLGITGAGGCGPPPP